MAAVAIVTALLLLSLPVAVIGNNFIEARASESRKRKEPFRFQRATVIAKLR